MIMKSLPSWFGEDSVRMIRFLGTSPDSTDIFSVIYNLMGQLADVFDQILEPDGAASFKKQTAYLPRFLRNVGRKCKSKDSDRGHIFILLDSIDQLSSAYNAHDMTWLPLDFPPNVHIILSMLPETHNCLANARKVIKDTNAFLELKPIAESTGQEIIDAYLKSKNRVITAAQNKLILSCLEKAPSPLFLKLLMDKSLTWHSYTPVDDIKLAASVREAINQQFKVLKM